MSYDHDDRHHSTEAHVEALQKRVRDLQSELTIAWEDDPAVAELHDKLTAADTEIAELKRQQEADELSRDLTLKELHRQRTRADNAESKTTGEQAVLSAMACVPVSTLRQWQHMDSPLFNLLACSELARRAEPQPALHRRSPGLPTPTDSPPAPRREPNL